MDHHDFDPLLLSRIEDASINASAAPQQHWLDGWIVRTCPGKAKRARCINAVADGRLPLDQRLALAAALYAAAGLPMVVRLTRFTLPSTLEGELAARGWTTMDDTRVMVLPHLPAGRVDAPPLPGTEWRTLGPEAYAEVVGAFRGSPPAQRQAQAQRVAASPVPYRGHALVDCADGSVLCCGQFAREAELMGLYDIHTRQDQRGRGLGRLLCERLLSVAASEGAQIAYLQVEADNAPAVHLYQRLGFAPGYAYHYRVAPGAQAG